ncbi:MAG: hypothetical protein LBM96_00465 [Methanobrevibacter sp.]|jgi:predicted nucleic acid-binding Zn ribbon protein|nr:hypothetical protein [Candidatus Methanoflexus mossambicus]
MSEKISSESKFCTNCGKSIDKNAEMCVHCGYLMQKNAKNKNVAMISKNDMIMNILGLIGSCLIIGFSILLFFNGIFVTYYYEDRVVELLKVVFGLILLVLSIFNMVYIIKSSVNNNSSLISNYVSIILGIFSFIVFYFSITLFDFYIHYAILLLIGGALVLISPILIWQKTNNIVYK